VSCEPGSISPATSERQFTKQIDKREIIPQRTRQSLVGCDEAALLSLRQRDVNTIINADSDGGGDFECSRQQRNRIVDRRESRQQIGKIVLKADE